jgi:hypothetical protein
MCNGRVKIQTLKWLKKIDKHTRRITICLYIIVSNNSAVVGIYMVTCITARNMGTFKRDP